MFDIGLGEILILGVLGLLVFGPERLPKAAADAARMLKQVRQMATGARKDLVDSAGIDFSEVREATKSIADLHPRRMMQSVMSGEDDDDVEPTKKRTPSQAKFDPDAT